MDGKNATAAGQGKAKEHRRKQSKSRKTTEIVALRGYDDVDALLRYIYDGVSEKAAAVKGYGVIHGTKDRADGCMNHQRKVSFGDVQQAKQAVLSAIAADCDREQGSMSGEERQTLFASLQRINKRSHDKIIDTAKKTFGWSSSTAQSTLSYLINSIAKVMVTKESMEGVASELAKRAAENKHSGDNDTATRQNLQKTFDRAERLFRRLQREYEELRSYEVALPVIAFGQATISEQEKALTAEERTLVVNILWTLAEQQVPEAFGAAMMYYGGTRTAESVAPLLGEIEICEEGRYAAYFVGRQIQNGKATDVLKTDNAYRQIILPGEAVRFVQLRTGQLRAAGFNGEQIKKIPLVSYTNKALSFVSAGALSGFVKDLLQMCGVKQERFATTDGAEKLVIEREEKQDITAYILRRDYATRGIYYCGITPAEMDYLLGHASDEVGYDVVRANRGTPDWKKGIADRLGRYVTVPELSTDSKVVPIAVSSEDRIALEGRRSLRLVAAEDCVVQVAVENTETIDYLHLDTEGEYVPESLKRTTVPEDVTGRKDRIIPMVTPLTTQQYERLRRRAQKIVKEKSAEESAAKSGEMEKEG